MMNVVNALEPVVGHGDVKVVARVYVKLENRIERSHIKYSYTVHVVRLNLRVRKFSGLSDYSANCSSLVSRDQSRINDGRFPAALQPI